MTDLEVLLSIIVVIQLFWLYAALKMMGYRERIRMCEAMAAAFRRCPNNHVDGAAWLSEQYIEELRKRGCDLERP